MAHRYTHKHIYSHTFTHDRNTYTCALTHIHSHTSLHTNTHAHIWIDAHVYSIEIHAQLAKHMQTPQTHTFTDTPLQSTTQLTHTDQYIRAREEEVGRAACQRQAVCGLLSCITGPINQSALKEPHPLGGCNWRCFPLGLFVTLKVSWQVQVCRTVHSRSSPAPEGKCVITKGSPTKPIDY